MANVPITSRSKWGAKPWNGSPHRVPASERTHFLVHYHGGEPRHDRGVAMAREVEAIHRANGWAGVGYNFLVGQDGGIFEGRGWDLVGAHCPGRNRDGIGVYVAIGGDQTPTKAALESVRALYDEASRRAGRSLVKSYHSAHYATACPGDKLRAWVKGGMKVAGSSSPSKPATPTVSLAAVVKAAKLDGPRKQGGTTPGAADDVRLVERALAAERLLPAKYAGDGSFGTSSVQAYAAWQRSLGYRGRDADGIPGKASLERLGKRHGFKVAK